MLYSIYLMIKNLRISSLSDLGSSTNVNYDVIRYIDPKDQFGRIDRNSIPDQLFQVLDIFDLC